MWVEVKQRLIAILNTLTPVEKTTLVIAESVPQTRSDHHDYLIVVRPGGSAEQVAPSIEVETELLTFIIECTSPTGEYRASGRE